MNTPIQTQPVLNSQSDVTEATFPEMVSDVMPDLDLPVLLPDTDLEDSKQDALPKAPRRMRPLRFATGLMLTTSGMVIILLIGVSMLELQQVGGDFALPLVAISVLSGVMLLGGGFGLMATASSGFDEQEFDRLLKAGNIASAELVRTSGAYSGAGSIDADMEPRD